MICLVVALTALLVALWALILAGQANERIGRHRDEIDGTFHLKGQRRACP